MIPHRIHSTVRLGLATLALATIGLGAIAAPAADAAGLRNCVDITGKNAGRVACYELVWVDGDQRRMTFSDHGFDGATPAPLDPFYVLAPQTDAPQGYPPNTFAHDHVVRAAPAGNHGTYSTRLQGFFVLCSGAGLGSGACVPAWTSVGGPDPLPFAKTVDGGALTSAGAIEAAVADGLVVALDLGPTAVIVGTLSGH